MRSEFEFHIRRLSILSRFLIISFVILFGGAAMHPAWAAIFPYSTYLWVWGENEAGELGNNGSVNVNRPQLTFGLPSGTLIMHCLPATMRDFLERTVLQWTETAMFGDGVTTCLAR